MPTIWSATIMVAKLRKRRLPFRSSNVTRKLPLDLHTLEAECERAEYTVRTRLGFGLEPLHHAPQTRQRFIQGHGSVASVPPATRGNPHARAHRLIDKLPLSHP